MASSKRFLQPINLLNSSSNPTEAEEGDFYYNTVSQKIRYYDGEEWFDLKSEYFEVSETPPGDPQQGQGWFNNVEGDFYIYDGTYWQQVVRTIEAGVMSLVGTENEINVSASVGAVTISLPNTINANTTGTAASLTTARTIALSGDVSGSATFDGSASVSITTQIEDLPPAATDTGPSFPLNPISGEFFFNTTTEKLYFFYETWNEISFTTIGLDGGTSSTTEFDGIFDGGNSTTLVFADGTYDGGNSATTF